MSKHICRAAVLTLGAVVALATYTAPAQAANTSALNAAEVTALLSGDVSASAVTWAYVRNVSTGKYLEVQNGSGANGAKIVQNNKVQGSQRQAFWLDSPSTGRTVFRTATTDPWKAISITGGGTGNGVKAIQYTYIHGNTNEQWATRVSARGEIVFTNINSGKCLEIPGNSRTIGVQADQWECINGATNEQWQLEAWPN